MSGSSGTVAQAGVRVEAAPRPRRGIIRRTARPAMYAILVAAAIFYLIPVYLLLLTGLKGSNEVTLDTMWRLPQTIGFGSFV